MLANMLRLADSLVAADYRLALAASSASRPLVASDLAETAAALAALDSREVAAARAVRRCFVL
jgi:hypothetical protein